jgi:hypothetical protein
MATQEIDQDAADHPVAASVVVTSPSVGNPQQRPSANQSLEIVPQQRALSYFVRNLTLANTYPKNLLMHKKCAIKKSAKPALVRAHAARMYTVSSESLVRTNGEEQRQWQKIVI